MGVTSLTTRAPWWLTWIIAVGLVLLFVGERLVGGSGFVRVVISGLGGAVVLAGVVWRFLSWRAATGEGKRVEGMLLASYVGCVLAVVGFVASSNDGMRWLGIAFEERAAERRFESALQVLSSILLAVSLFPALGAQWALAAHRHAGQTAIQMESQRVHETSAAALTVALAGAALMLAGYVGAAWDKTVDVSYFKTASPGTGAQEMVRNMPDPLRVLSFLPDVSAVKDEVTGYFRALADATGNVVIEEYDRVISPALAQEYNVTTDGMVVLVRGDRSERIDFPLRIATARAGLRTLDRDMQERLWRLARAPRRAYLTVGHGELGDPSSSTSDEADPLQSVAALKDGLQVFNYQAENLGLRQGLGRAIPDDAAMVLVLGPKTPFLEEELEALDRYLAAGGAVLLAIDPDSDFQLGPLEARLGIRYQAIPLANDAQYMRRRGNLSDRQLIITDRFSAHEAVTTVGRTRVGSGILLVGSGYLEQADGGGPRPRFVVMSLRTTFADLNENYEFDSATEVRMEYNLVAAIEGGESDAPGMRALVYADAGMFTDGVINSIALNAALFADGVRWLGGDEEFGGEIASEVDVPIVHTRAQNVAWFYSTILGAPLLILAAGIATVTRRRSGRTSA